MKIVLKELRETFIALKILGKDRIVENGTGIDDCLKECNELIAIFVKSIQTAESRRTNCTRIKNR